MILPDPIGAGWGMPWILPALGAILGLVAGSFLAALALRWPRGQSVMRGRSACDACGHRLGVVDLLPVFGHLLRRGRCAYCGAPIDRRHLLIELASGGIGLVSLLAAPGLEGLCGAMFGWLLVALIALDVDHFWLPDELVAALAVVGVGAGLAGIAPPMADRLIGGLAGFAGLAAIAILYRVARGRTGMGGGDPKLLGAIGLTLGWQALPLVLLGGASVGLALLGVRRLRGDSIRADQEVPLGALMAVVAWPLWLVAAMA